MFLSWTTQGNTGHVCTLGLVCSGCHSNWGKSQGQKERSTSHEIFLICAISQ